jgi:hypothetical protein
LKKNRFKGNKRAKHVDKIKRPIARSWGRETERQTHRERKREIEKDKR